MSSCYRCIFDFAVKIKPSWTCWWLTAFAWKTNTAQCAYRIHSCVVRPSLHAHSCELVRASDLKLSCSQPRCCSAAVDSAQEGGEIEYIHHTYYLVVGVLRKQPNTFACFFFFLAGVHPEDIRYHYRLASTLLRRTNPPTDNVT